MVLRELPAFLQRFFDILMRSRTIRTKKERENLGKDFGIAVAQMIPMIKVRQNIYVKWIMHWRRS